MAYCSEVPGLVRILYMYLGARLTFADEASFQDRQRLLKEYGVKSIIDLRTK
jgi:protein-tyrosine phosphatase